MKIVIIVASVTLLTSMATTALAQSTRQEFENCVRGAYYAGRTEAEQAKLCMEIEVEKQRREFYRNLNERGSSSPATSSVEPVIAVLPAKYFENLRDEFQKERPILLGSLRVRATSLAQATDVSAFENPSTEAETLMLRFISKYSYIRDRKHPEIAQFLARLQETVDLLKRARSAWRGEVDQAARVNFLIAQKSVPTSARDPYAHPFVIDANIEKTREMHLRNAHDRQALIPLANEALTSLTKE